MNTFTQQQAIADIKKRQGKMTLGAFAETLGVSGQLIGDIYRGKILPGEKVGFKKITESIRFRRTDGTE